MENIKRGKAFYQAHACMDSFICKQCGRLTPDEAEAAIATAPSACTACTSTSGPATGRPCESVMEPISVWVRNGGMGHRGTAANAAGT